MAARHSLDWTEISLLRNVVGRTHDAIGAPLPETHPMRRPAERRFAMARGAVNGKPFLSQLVVDPSTTMGTHFWTRGHLTAENEETAIRRAMVKLSFDDVASTSDSVQAAGDEWELYRRMRDEAQVWLRVDPSTNGAAKRLGARWDGGIDCWFAMTGVDLQAFEEIGVVPRARPEWRRLEGPERIDRSRARELGARRLTENLYIDVLDADEATLQAVRHELGARIMESIDQRWAWKAVNDINAEPPADAFPEWSPADRHTAPAP